MSYGVIPHTYNEAFPGLSGTKASFFLVNELYNLNMRSYIITIVSLFLSWKILLFFPLVVSEAFLSPRIGYGYTLFPYFLDKENVLSNFLLSPFANFDGAYYLLIAAKGYTVNAGFFPLFPLLIHLLSPVFGNKPFLTAEFLAGNLLVGAGFFLALIIFYKLIRLDYRENIAILSIIFLLIFPTSFFFASIYSESLFLLLSLLSFYFARKKKWIWAGIAGGFLSATRIVGIAMWPALLYEYFKQNKNKLSIKLIPLFFAPFGLTAYVIYNTYRWGDPFYFIEAQGNFQNNRSVDSIILPTQTIFRYFKILTTVNPRIYEWWVAFFELSFFILALILLFIAWKKKVRASYLIFGLLCLFIPSLTGTLSGIPRYVSIIFPIFITLALIKNKGFKIIYFTVSAVLLFIFFMLFSKGYFIS